MLLLNLPDDTVNDEKIHEKCTHAESLLEQCSCVVVLQAYQHSHTKTAHNNTLDMCYLIHSLKCCCIRAHTHVYTHQHLWTNNIIDVVFLPFFHVKKRSWVDEMVEECYILWWEATIFIWKLSIVGNWIMVNAVSHFIHSHLVHTFDKCQIITKPNTLKWTHTNKPWNW